MTKIVSKRYVNEPKILHISYLERNNGAEFISFWGIDNHVITVNVKVMWHSLYKRTVSTKLM